MYAISNPTVRCLRSIISSSLRVCLFSLSCTPARCIDVFRREYFKTEPSMIDSCPRRGFRIAVGTHSQKLNCWKCRKSIFSEKNELFCSNCHAIQPPMPSKTLFEVMRCDESFDVDIAGLSDMFRFLQSQLHPDKFSQASKKEIIYSSDHSSLVNLSYRTLISPLARGEYLLKLKGNSIEEDQTEFGGDFLAEIMDANERLDELSNTDELLEFQLEIEGNINHCIRRASHRFNTGDIVAAKDAIKRLKFYQSIMELLKNKLVPSLKV